LEEEDGRTQREPSEESDLAFELCQGIADVPGSTSKYHFLAF
jgi:hypothetical protein